MMKNDSLILLVLICNSIFMFPCCKKEKANLPTVTTSDVSAITDTTAHYGGNVISDGGSLVTARGVVWSQEDVLRIQWHLHTYDGSGLGDFTGNITNLKPATKYNVAAYATNSVGTAYGNEISFTTLQQPFT